MRMNAFNDTGLGEPEQDANTALIELDKGLFILSIFRTLVVKQVFPNMCK